MRFLRKPALLRLAAFWALAIAMQWSFGAYQAEAVRDSDEAAHIVTGVMLREYLMTGLSRSPQSFALDYYQHYPKVAIGHWPPLFYVEQAAWTALFPASRASLLVMIALQTGLLAALLWPVLNSRFGFAAGLFGSLVLVTLPGIARATGMIMTEVPLAVLILLAVLQWGKYLETTRVRHAVAFGLWSSAAILMKGTGLVLALVPLLSIVIAGRINLMRRMSFWYPGIIVIVCCGPWYMEAPGALHQRVAAYGGVGLATHRISTPSGGWEAEFGPLIVLLALLGCGIFICVRCFADGPDRDVDGTMAGAVALTMAAVLAPFFVAAWEVRHLAESSAAILLVACFALHSIGSLYLFRGWAGSLKIAILVTGSCLAILWNLQTLPKQHAVGYRQLAVALLNQSLGPAQAVVVVGDGIAEGAIIAEVALRQPQPQRYILRGTKLFADIEWMGKLNALKVNSAAEVDGLLTGLPVDLILIDRKSPTSYAYQPMLEDAIAQHPEKWDKVDNPSDSQRFAIFRRKDQPSLSLAEVAVKLRDGLPNPISSR